MISLGITRDYLRAITKVAFHYFLLQQPRYTGSEPTFEPVRRFIRIGVNFENEYRLVPAITEEALRGGGLPNWTHFLAGEITYDELAARVQSFVGPETVPPAWRCVLRGTHPQSISTPKPSGTSSCCSISPRAATRAR